MKITKTKVRFPAIGCSNFAVECVLHETTRSFEEAFGPGGQDTYAFCTVGYARRRKLVARLHYCRKFINRPLVAHEITHAMLAVSRRLRLKGDNGLGEELMAMITENITRHVLNFLQKQKVKMKANDAIETAPSGLN